MPESFLISLDVPDDIARFRLPAGVQHRLTELLDRQDHGEPLTDAERAEAEALVSLADLLGLLKLRAERATATAPAMNLSIRQEEAFRGRHPPA